MGQEAVEEEVVRWPRALVEDVVLVPVLVPGLVQEGQLSKEAAEGGVGRAVDFQPCLQTIYCL